MNWNNQQSNGGGGSIFSNPSNGHAGGTNGQGTYGQNDGYSNVESFISQNFNSGAAGQQQGQDNVQALLEAAKNKDMRAFAKLAGIDQGAALASISSIAEDDNVAGLKQEIASLKQELSTTKDWIGQQEQQQQSAAQQSQRQRDIERLKAGLDGNAHFYLKNLDEGADMLYDTVVDFRNQYGRNPTPAEISQLSNAVNDSLGQRVQALRELKVPDSTLGNQGNQPGQGTGQPGNNPNTEQSLGSRPTVSNASHPSTRVSDPNNLDLSDEACIARAMEAISS